MDEREVRDLEQGANEWMNIQDVLRNLLLHHAKKLQSLETTVNRLNDQLQKQEEKNEILEKKIAVLQKEVVVKANRSNPIQGAKTSPATTQAINTILEQIEKVILLTLQISH